MPLTFPSHPGHVLPPWWYHEFGGIPLPFYVKPYPVAPHFFAWLAASVLGLFLYVAILRRRSAQ